MLLRKYIRIHFLYASQWNVISSHEWHPIAKKIVPPLSCCFKSNKCFLLLKLSTYFPLIHHWQENKETTSINRLLVVSINTLSLHCLPNFTRMRLESWFEKERFILFLAVTAGVMFMWIIVEGMCRIDLRQVTFCPIE